MKEDQVSAFLLMSYNKRLFVPLFQRNPDNQMGFGVWVFGLTVTKVVQQSRGCGFKSKYKQMREYLDNKNKILNEL